MKRLLYPMAFLLALAGCSSPADSTVSPADSPTSADRGRRLAGTYEVNTIGMQVGTYPQQVIQYPILLNGKPVLSSQIKVERKAENLINLAVSTVIDKSVFQQGAAVENISYQQDMEIQTNGNGYDLYGKGRKIARFDDNAFVVTIEETNKSGETVRMELKATKQ
ncbi:hypothetical protein ACAW74_05955 [Fibrella sp. WM1]|uniref:hypothetical protein n=1 Tax=Fibrella musci TaxID=3242485 RepID=UPI003521B5A2